MKKTGMKWLLLVVVLILSLGIVGCTNDANEDSNVDEQVDQVTDSTDDAVKDAEDSVREMNYEDIKLTPAQVFDQFMELHAGAKIIKIALDKELMEYQYVVEGYDDKNEYEVKINPVDGKLISDDSEPVDMDEDDVVITKDILANVDSIIEKAKKEDASNSELDEWTISSEDGRLVMEVEIGAMEYSYDLATQELLKNDL